MQLPLKTGQVIEVNLVVQGRDVSCEAVVLAIGERSFVISPPKRKGVLIPVEMDRISVTVNNADAIHTMLCRVEVLNGNSIALALPVPEAIQRLQRRKFVRVRTKLPCLLETEGEEQGEFEEVFEAKMQDISGGGCSVILSPTVPKGTLVRLSFELPEEGKVIAIGRVIRSTIVRQHHGSNCQLSIEFQHISEFTRSKVIRFVFSIQRQMAWRADSQKNTRPLSEPPN